LLEQALEAIRLGKRGGALDLSKTPVEPDRTEATGGYERPVLDFLHKAGHRVARAMPCGPGNRLRGLGQAAKTDRLDAYALAQMATLVELPADQPPTSGKTDCRAGRSTARAHVSEVDEGGGAGAARDAGQLPA